MSKLIILLLALWAAWYGWRKLMGPPVRPPRTPEPEPSRIVADDMDSCRVCGTYVAVGAARSCGRADCPYPPG